MSNAGLAQVKLSVGARRARDPFTVLIASGTRLADVGHTRKQTPPQGHPGSTCRLIPVRHDHRRRFSTPSIAGSPSHPHPRRRDGHDDPALHADGGGLPRRALRAIIRRTSRATTTCSDPDAARRDPRDPPRSTSPPAPTSSRRTRSAHRVAQADYGLEHARLRAEPRGRAAGARGRCDEWTAKTPDKPRFVAGSIGPTNRTLSISPDVNDPAFRATTFDELRGAYDEQVRGLVDGGADLLLLETIFDTLNAKAGIFAIENVFEETGRPPAADDLGHHHRPQRPDAVGADARGVLHLDPPRASRSASASTARWARATCGRTSRTWRGSPTATSAAIRTPACPTRSASTTSRPTRPRSLLREFADQRLGQHRRRLLRDHAGAHRRIAAAVEGVTPRRRPSRDEPDLGLTSRHGGFTPALRPRAAGHPSRQQFPDDRRADQRHRLGALRAADQIAATMRRRRTSRSIRSAAAPTSSTSTWTKACSIPSRR